MSPKAKSILSSLLKFLLAGGIITWLISTGRLDLRLVTALFTSPIFFVGLFLAGANLFLTSERWRLLATPQDVKAGSGEVFRLTLIGTFFNYAIPGGVGGDVVKAYYFGKDHPHARTAAITSVILDRILGLYAMVFMAVAVMSWDLGRVMNVPVLHSLYIALILLFVVFSLGLLVVFSRRFKRTGWLASFIDLLPFSAKFMKLYETTHRFGLLRGRVIAALGLSLLAQSVSIVFLWVAGNAAGYGEIPLITYFLVAPLGYMATAIPISPAGIGVGQLAFLKLFELYVHDGAAATPPIQGLGPAVITAQQAMMALFGLIGAVLYIRRSEPAPSTPPEAEET